MRKSDINLPLFTSDYDFQGTVVNRALTYLHGGSHRNTLYSPFKIKHKLSIFLTEKRTKEHNSIMFENPAFYKSLANQRYKEARSARVK